jgi:pimeloyl-ACP methyl ester carboxylesterase
VKRLLFLPGAGGDPAFWRPLGELLPRHWEKTYLGWPGLGDQPPSAAVRGFDDLVHLVEGHLAAGPADLLAQSMGGAVAIRAALNQPQRVRRLVLVATSGGIDLAPFGAADWRAGYQRSFPRAAAWIRAVRLDFAGELAALAQPTLLLWGDADPISPVAVGETLQRLLPCASLEIVPGGDHDLVHARPHEVRAAIERHLA